MQSRKLIITESQLRRIVTESVTSSQVLYHKSPRSTRKSILSNGLIPSVGDSYRAHWDDREDLKPLIFLYDHESIKGGEYDSTYDDDIYAVDVTQLDGEHLSKDPDKSMYGCLAYDLPIPPSAIRLVYKGRGGDSDERTMKKHSGIY